MDNCVNISDFSTDLGIAYSKYASSKLRKDYWVVKKGFNHHLDQDGRQVVTVPMGFLTDGATVPRLLWSLIPPWGAYGQAAVLHDWLCEFGYYTENGVKRYLTRSQCDYIFLQAMRELGVGWMTRTAMYVAVSTYTKTIYKIHKANDQPIRLAEQEIRAYYDKTGEWV